MSIIHKPGPDLYITDWLSRQSHAENRDEKLAGLLLSINAIDV